MHDIQTQLNEVERIHAEAQRSMDRFTGLLKTTYTNPTPAAMQILRTEHRELNRVNALLEIELNKLKEKSQMKRISFAIVSLFVLFIMVSSFAVAQDTPLATNTVEGVATLVSSEPIPTAVPAPAATEVPAGNETPAGGNNSLIELAKVVAPWLGAIGIVGLLVAGLLGREALVHLGKSQPAGLREPVFSGVETGLAKLEEYTHTTATTIDDAAAAELKRFFLGVIDEIRADAGKATLNKNVTPPGPSLYPDDPQIGTVVRPASDQGAWHPQYPIDEQPQG